MNWRIYAEELLEFYAKVSSLPIENVTKEIYSFLLKNSRGPKNKIIFKAKSLSNL